MSSSTSGQNCRTIKQSSGSRTAEFTVIKNRDEQLWWEEPGQGLSHCRPQNDVDETHSLVWTNKADQHLRERIGNINLADSIWTSLLMDKMQREKVTKNLNSPRFRGELEGAQLRAFRGQTVKLRRAKPERQISRSQGSIQLPGWQIFKVSAS